ncbi:hypothetical protein WJX72_004445 [[Myrmecia] bisecta]|uniref:UBA domain-containing protein n=1 Tax=[Myrmecia] bisecta TaxID=41462 RepID=A0AAW1PEC1_9CHLO
MATRPGADKRGPKLGDAASLWNFTPSPGWNKEEVQILRLCLMKFGVGKWVHIQETGLLPGKLIQQLNGQTQRLLGQQSLAAVTGLHVDIDRIRAENELRKDVERKAGLIINSGPNPTKKLREQWQAEAKAKYGLTSEQIREAELALEELAATVHHVAGARSAHNSRVPTISLMEADLAELSKEQKVALLKRLRVKLQAMLAQATSPDPAAAATAAAAGVVVIETAGSAQPDGLIQTAATPLSRENVDGSDEAMEDAAAAPMAQQAGGGGTKAATSKANQSGAKKPRAAAKRKSAAVAADGAQPKRGRGKKSAAAAEPMSLDGDEAAADVAASTAAAGLQADIAQLQAMGFSKAQAKDALEEANYDVEGAIEWLVANCI